MSPITNKTMESSSNVSPKQHFQQHASAYERGAGATSSRLAAAALARLPLSSYTSSSHILDSAAGPGIVTKLLLSPSPPDVSVPGLPISPAPRVTGIDLAPAMIESFMANKAALRWVTADAFVQDSGDLSRFKDAEFDAVVMSLGIFALPDPVAGAAEMYRVLKPGGYVAITTWKVRRAADVLQGIVDAIRPNSGLKPMDMPLEWTTKEKLVSVIEKGGFSIDQMEVSQASPNWECGSEEEVVRNLSSPMWTARIWAGWSTEEKGRWGDEIRKQLRDQEKETGTLEMTAWICIARKT
ncbi:S-adenosyl-L-methionine-dependent methyltransferase [Hypoxylon rubiginosum]|uniref:S-adenosyl-L-methionine-dependent methyltransferase n=1 Tax=Hypoxylon rubiginosum TaxID=110542 RepID=A0ACC0DG29_9PEZI|nr:S-adenosyl-L-methionine-dependent methyltransferase [Hypoxylon rubiginosum]